MSEARAIDSDLLPEDYPWTPAPYPMLVTPQETHPLVWTQGTPLLQAQAGPGKVSDYYPQGTTPGDMSLVLAIGSNASVDVMRNKFQQRCPNDVQVFPVVPGQIRNMAVCYAPIASHRGYVADTPIHVQGCVTRVWGSWLTPHN